MRLKREALVEHWVRLVTDAALPFEANWTWRQLRMLNDEFGKRLRDQRDYFDRAAVTDSLERVVMIGQATIRGYAEAVALMERNAVKQDKISAAKRGPDLQALVEAHGGYDKIPEEAWEEFDRAVIVWKAKLRNGEFEAEFADPSKTEEALQ